jgi:hypothetical protein
MPIIATRASAAYGAGFAAVTTPPYAGPFGSYDSLASVALSSATSSITFGGIPANYKHLQVRVMALTATSGKVMFMRFNADSSSSYTWHFLNGQGSSVTGGNQTGNAYSRFFGQNIGTNTTNPTVSIVDVLDYANTSKNKTMRALSGSDNNGTGEVSLESSLWIKTEAINALSIALNDSSNFAANSHFALYGIK